MRERFLFVTTAVVVCIAAPVAEAFQGAARPLKLHGRSSSPGQVKELGHRIPSLPIRPGHRLRLNGGLGSLGTVATTSAPVAAAPVEKFRKDYKFPDYSVRTVDLTFKIYKGHTQVRCVFDKLLPLYLTRRGILAGSFVSESQEKGRCSIECSAATRC